MLPAHPFASKRGDLLWLALSVVVLVPCLYYPYASRHPDPGFTLTGSWEVLHADPCPPGTDCPRVGDRVLAIGELTRDAFGRDRWVELFDAFSGGRAAVAVLRDGERRTVEARLRDGSIERALLVALFPAVFWLMGTVAIIFLRPRDERWLVLVLFSYVTALWLASGLASSRHTDGASVVFHVFIWLFLPLAVHLHVLLPSPLLGRRRWALLGPLYALSLALVVADAGHLLPASEFLPVVSFAAGIVLALGLLGLRLVLPAPPAVKVANRIMAFGVALGFAPVLLFFFALPLLLARLGTPAAEVDAFEPWALGVSLLAIPLLPLSYVYAIYKHHFSALEFRANRLLGVYGFFTLYLSVYVWVLLLGGRWGAVDGRFLTTTLLVSLAFVAAAPALRSRFQALVDRHVFGVKYLPEEVVEIVSARVPTAFDRSTLARAVRDDVLPTLLVRQSALYLFEGDGAEALYEQALPEREAPPDAAELRALLVRSGIYLPPLPGPPDRLDWVRLVLPLTLQGETIGIWLIGRRDPDDYFPASDIHLLSTVANQIAPVAENIRLHERARQEITRFRTLFEATLEGIAIVRQGVILEVNHALEGVFACPADELIGRRFAELAAGAEVGPGTEPHETIGLRRDGTPVEIEVAAKSYVFRGEDVTVVAVRDITRRKRDEAEKKRLEQQLLHAQKLEAIGRLSAGIAHDFNNCLLAVLGYADLLLSRYPADPFLRRNLSGIKDAGQKAGALTKQLLAFARRQPMEAKVVPFNSVITSIEKMLRRLIGDDVALLTALDPSASKVRLDPGRMEQVVVNLALNARHAMPHGGRLTLRTETVEVREDEPAAHPEVPPGRYVRFSVADTGVGMDAETQARVFEPFFSTRKAGEGTGLGLSTAYGFVKQSGGHVFVDSAPGQGTRFSIYLPVAAEEPGVEAAVVPGAGRGSETVLLVEDEPEVRGVVSSLLLDLGYRVLVAQSGREALSAAERHEEPLHLLLTDVTMPEMSGRELASRLLDLRPATRVLYMSGHQEELSPSETAAPGFLQKPFSAEDLGRAVRAVLDGPAPTVAAQQGAA